jgi:hypothetical protein
MKYYDFLFFQHFKQESCESAQVNAGLGPPGGFFQRLIRMTMMMMTMMTMKLLLKSQLKLFPVVLTAHSPVACLLAPETDKACHHPTPLTLLTAKPNQMPQIRTVTKKQSSVSYQILYGSVGICT